MFALATSFIVCVNAVVFEAAAEWQLAAPAKFVTTSPTTTTTPTTHHTVTVTVTLSSSTTTTEDDEALEVEQEGLSTAERSTTNLARARECERAGRQVCVLAIEVELLVVVPVARIPHSLSLTR